MTLRESGGVSSVRRVFILRRFRADDNLRRIAAALLRTISPARVKLKEEQPLRIELDINSQVSSWSDPCCLTILEYTPSRNFASLSG